MTLFYSLDHSSTRFRSIDSKYFLGERDLAFAHYSRQAYTNAVELVVCSGDYTVTVIHRHCTLPKRNSTTNILQGTLIVELFFCVSDANINILESIQCDMFGHLYTTPCFNFQTL